MKVTHCIAFALVVIGSINWLLVAFNFNLVDAIFGQGSVMAKIVYILVGIAALLLVVTHKKHCKRCETAPAATV